MNLKHILVSLSVVSLLGIGVAVAQEATPPMQQLGAIAMLQDASGNSVGQVTFSEDNTGKVVIVVDVSGLSAGFHGFHVHTTGQCDASGSEPFASAGEHLNPSGANQPDQAGDLPPLLVNADGTGQMTLVTDRFKLADLFDTDGSAVVINADPDNFANIPSRYNVQPDSQTLMTGDSGTRIACGVIQQDQGMTAG